MKFSFLFQLLCTKNWSIVFFANFIQFLKSVDYISKKDAQKAAELQLDLEKSGKIVNKTSIMIAAIALNKNAFLCTMDKKFYALKEQELKLFLDDTFINQM